MVTRLLLPKEAMRDLLFKNHISTDRKRKAISSAEVIDKEGVRTAISRHFVCLVKEIKDANEQKPLPYLYVLKEHNQKEQREKFFCKVKGSVLIAKNNSLFLILFMHSLKITLKAVAQVTN